MRGERGKTKKRPGYSDKKDKHVQEEKESKKRKSCNIDK